ncbi:hypothetical protein [Frankia sp. CiP1_Cm_nod1]|uniref:hypothetical protein n=1 Tax=Frankia sp. CiP1_Cm_nod1 TaxID=2897160 RepID=UPI002024933D
MVTPPRLRFDGRGVAVPEPTSTADTDDFHDPTAAPFPDTTMPGAAPARLPIGPAAVRRRRRRSSSRQRQRQRARQRQAGRRRRRPFPRQRARIRRRARSRRRIRALVRRTAVLLIVLGAVLVAAAPGGPAGLGLERAAVLLDRIATVATPW